MPVARIDDKAPERCSWCGTDPLYVHYHDTVWGRPEYSGLALFEKLCLDGQQAGLSWITILRKQESYRAAYDDFNPEKIIQYGDAKTAELLANPGIVRNKLKVKSIIKNARGFLDLQAQGSGFSDFLWSFVENSPMQNTWRNFDEVPVTTPESEAMSRALKRAGFTFVGPTIVYAFMQATGMVNDHMVYCPQHKQCRLQAQ
jgi:DNA-3-methyladenine glycosylase I